MISAGLCGGLLPEQTPGMVVIASQVVDEQGATHACDPGVVAALEKAARYLRLPCHERVVGLDVGDGDRPRPRNVGTAAATSRWTWSPPLRRNRRSVSACSG